MRRSETRKITHYCGLLNDSLQTLQTAKRPFTIGGCKAGKQATPDARELV
jgi:hypothetical protein